MKREDSHSHLPKEFIKEDSHLVKLDALSITQFSKEEYQFQIE
jgi:hypothetical protein